MCQYVHVKRPLGFSFFYLEHWWYWAPKQPNNDEQGLPRGALCHGDSGGVTVGAHGLHQAKNGGEAVDLGWGDPSSQRTPDPENYSQVKYSPFLSGLF